MVHAFEKPHTTEFSGGGNPNFNFVQLDRDHQHSTSPPQFYPLLLPDRRDLAYCEFVLHLKEACTINY